MILFLVCLVMMSGILWVRFCCMFLYFLFVIMMLVNGSSWLYGRYLVICMLLGSCLVRVLSGWFFVEMIIRMLVVVSVVIVGCMSWLKLELVIVFWVMCIMGCELLRFVYYDGRGVFEVEGGRGFVKCMLVGRLVCGYLNLGIVNCM